MLCAFNTKIKSTVESPLKATSLQQSLFFGGQSIHRLLFKPLYNFHFLSVPKVALVKGFNCTVVNAKSKPANYWLGHSPPGPWHAVFFGDRTICFSLCFCNLEKDKWSSKCLSFLPLDDQIRCQFMRMKNTETKTYPEQYRTVNWPPNRNFKMMFENSIYYTHESANTQNVSTGDKSV